METRPAAGVVRRLRADDLALGVAWWFETEFLKDLFAGGILKGVQLQGMHVDLPRMKLVPTLSGGCRRQKS